MVGGIISQRIVENEKTVGYNLININSSEKSEFLCLSDNMKFQKIGRYSILPQGLALGQTALCLSSNIMNRVVIIDEAGFLELNNGGWAEQIDKLLNASYHTLILSVRDQFVQDFIEKWSIKNYSVFNVSEKDCDEIASEICKEITK